ncbi:MAG: hypothetical protein AAF705_08825 [Bacteroidota bacterium]
MAKQAIGFKVKSGSIGDLQFGTRKDGNGRKQYIVGEKGGVDRATILSAPEFENTRRNMSEFGRAGQLSKNLNNDLSFALAGTKDSQATSRFTGLVRKMMNLDPNNVKGERVLDLSVAAVAQGLTGFSWSKENFGNIQIGGLNVSSVDATSVNLIGDGALSHPSEAAKAEVDYISVVLKADGTIIVGRLDFGHVAVDGLGGNYDGETFNHGGASGDGILVIGSVKFFQTVNGADYELKNKSYRAATIVHAGVIPV